MHGMLEDIVSSLCNERKRWKTILTQSKCNSIIPVSSKTPRDVRHTDKAAADKAFVFVLKKKR